MEQLKYLKGDMWKYYNPQDNTMFGILTNGMLKNDGENVMGKGVALQCKNLFPLIPKILGTMIRFGGNHVYYLGSKLFSFPTKHHWFGPSDLNLIARSAKELMSLKELYGWRWIILPKPGCGEGGLIWEQVEQILSPILSEEFYIIDK